MLGRHNEGKHPKSLVRYHALDARGSALERMCPLGSLNGPRRRGANK
jgi:hypothetical protein